MAFRNSTLMSEDMAAVPSCAHNHDSQVHSVHLKDCLSFFSSILSSAVALAADVGSEISVVKRLTMWRASSEGKSGPRVDKKSNSGDHI